MVTTVDLLIEKKGTFERREVRLAADVVLYRGSMVFINTTTGLAQSTIVGAIFAGIATSRFDSTGEAAGAVGGEVFSDGSFLLKGSGFSQASVGDEVEAVDNDTIAAGNTPLIGTVSKYVSATEVWVEIKGLSN